MGLTATILTMLLIGLGSALAGLGMLRIWTPAAEAPPPGLSGADDEGVVFLFENQRLIDATSRARSLLPPAHPGRDDWSRFLAAFAPRFPRLELRLQAMQPGEELTLAGTEGEPGALQLHGELHAGVLRVALTEPVAEDRSERFERYAVQAMEMELDTLRSVAEDSPVLTWRQQDDGTVIWANRAYMAEIRRDFGDEALAAWPPRTLFPGLIAMDPELAGKPQRIWRSDSKGERSWYELRCQPEAAGRLCFATPIDQLVQAEASLRDFIGTLGKTFAQLPIGLAIFDAKRRLVLFNPALIDLTALGPEMLTQRPTLHAFLDALRENQRIPEPRDYKSWRLRIAQLEAAAEDGRYKETWTLPTGQTYRVTGQPHPDGAVAFLFEDISSDVSLKRRFRSEIDLGLSVFNAFDQAIAVFDSDGTLVMSNAAYARFWGIAPETSLSRIGLRDALAHWSLREDEGDRIRDITAFVRGERPRHGFCLVLRTRDGRCLRANIRPLPQRATLIELLPCAEARVPRDCPPPPVLAEEEQTPA